MYTAVLLTALATTSVSPTWHRGCYGCSCYGGYPTSYNPGCYGCSCYGYGMAGGVYGYQGGWHGAYGAGYDPRYGGCSGCYGCYGGYSCYGIPVPAASTTSRTAVGQPLRDAYPPINPTTKMEVTPDKDGAEEVGAPKPKDIKKTPGPAKMPEEKKSLRLDPNAPLRAKVRIEIPEGGKLFVDDHAINGPVGTRMFQTPPLAPGERYFYDIRIERAGEIRSRRVIIEPGQEIAVSFPGLAPTARVNR